MATAKSITPNASNQPVKSPSTNTLATRNGYTIEVHSYTRNTNFAVKAGEKLNIEATGSIVLGGWVGSGGPEGISGYRMYCIIPNYQLGALLFRVGNGEWKAVGTKTSVIMQSSGMLQLMVNDSDPDNNSGSFQVKITK